MPKNNNQIINLAHFKVKLTLINFLKVTDLAMQERVIIIYN